MKTAILAVFLAFVLPVKAETLLLRDPDLGPDSLLFVHAGDIWETDLAGAGAVRLTTLPGEESNPARSPDGKWIAFSARTSGQADVYVMPASGGQPTRLSFHPEDDIVRGWSPDSRRILFTSPRELSYQRGGHLYEVALSGGMPERLPLPVAYDGAWFADGARLAYQPFPSGNSGRAGWRGYRGGATPSIRIVTLADGTLRSIPHAGSNDEAPRVIGQFVYFLSDRSGMRHIWRHDSQSGALFDIDPAFEGDIDSFSVRDETVLFASNGRLHLLDQRSRERRSLKITLPADYPERLPKFVAANGQVEDAVLSPDGGTVLLAARGELIALPVAGGRARLLTHSPGARDRSPLYLPDGGGLAWLSDADGEYRLMLGPADGSAAPRSLALGEDRRGWFRLLDAAPDGSFLLYEDGALGLWSITPRDGKSTLIARHDRRWRPHGFETAISPDSRLIAFVRMGKGLRRELLLHDIQSGKTYPVADALVSAGAPVFSPDGRYLWFTASDSQGPASPWLDMSSRERPIRRGVFAAILRENDPSPVGFLSDADKEDRSARAELAAPLPPRSLASIGTRIVSIPIAARDWRRLAFAKDGALLLLADQPDGAEEDLPGNDGEAMAALYRYDPRKRRETILLDGIADMAIDGGRTRLLLRRAKGALSLLPTDAEPGTVPKSLALEDIRIPVDPAAEWEQIFVEAWRIERDFFYDAEMHGLDWPMVGTRYRRFLPHVGTRAELNRLLVAMISELGVGHARAFGGDIAPAIDPSARTGLLGVDYQIENGRVRIARILDPGPFVPFLASPLGIAGLGVREGDYLLAIDGVPLGAGENVHRLLEGKAGIKTLLRLSHESDGKSSYEIVVEPIPNERSLRINDFAEANRRHVAQESGGRIGYVYLPNTAEDGFRAFNRFFYGQLESEALILDERGNRGGQAADYIVETLARRPLGIWRDRAGLPFTTPAGAMVGPKAMLIDQFAGSGGDFLPDAFRRLGLGTLIGTRTWGGLIGIGVAPPLVDGGTVTSPYFRFADPDTGAWAIENEGVAPDLEIEILPADHLAGRDPQLDAAIRLLLLKLDDPDRQAGTLKRTR